MINVAIVEDEEQDAAILEQFLDRYAHEKGETFHVTRFADGLKFLTNYRAVYDIVFMDIEMPGINGMDSARKLREMDENVVLIFVTNLARYAITGYEVGALDYILKPLRYPAFVLKIAKAVSQSAQRRREKVLIKTRDGVNSFPVSAVTYVESRGHGIVYHLTVGEVHSYGTLKEVEAQFAGGEFFRCNSCYLVNLKYVSGCRKNDVILTDGEIISVSRARKKELLDALRQYLLSDGGGGE